MKLLCSHPDDNNMKYMLSSINITMMPRAASSTNKRPGPSSNFIWTIPRHSGGAVVVDSPTISTTIDTKRHQHHQHHQHQQHYWTHPTLSHDSMTLSTSTSSRDSSTYLKSCFKSLPETTTSTTSEKKTVSFDSISIREHPRILGDNPSVKKGPALSLGWYDPKIGRNFSYTVDEYERNRVPLRKKNLTLSSKTRKRLLINEAGVTVEEIYVARQEISLIKKSRKQHNNLVRFDDTAVAFENIMDNVKRVLRTGSTRELELQNLLDQAHRATTTTSIHHYQQQ